MNQNGLIRKYLLYSIGEVLLVMIGILLALQVNNWNEERKLIREGNGYIKDLYQDLSKDKDNLQRIVERLQEQHKSSEWILDAHKTAYNTPIDTLKFTRNVILSSFPFVVQRADNTYDELKSSGRRDIIRDKELVRMLNDFYFLYDLRISNFNELPKATRYEHRRILAQYPDIEDWRYEQATNKKSLNQFNTVLKNPNLYNLLMEIHISCHFNITFFRELKDNAELVIRFIEQNHTNVINDQ